MFDSINRRGELEARKMVAEILLNDDDLLTVGVVVVIRLVVRPDLI